MNTSVSLRSVVFILDSSVPSFKKMVDSIAKKEKPNGYQEIN